MLAFLALVPALPAQAGLFNSRFDDFKELVEAGRIEEAAALSEKEVAYFAGLKDHKRRYVDEVLGQRDRRYRAELGEARAQLVMAEREEGQMRRWQQLKQALPEAKAVQARIGTLSARGALVSAGIDAMNATADRITRALQADAPRALLDYGLFTEPAFPTLYPVAVRWTDHPDLAGRVGAQLDAATARQLEVFRKAYGDTLVPAMGVGPKLGELYVAARVRESGASSYLAKRLVRDRLANEGWPLLAENDGRVLLAAWPALKSEVSQWQIEPPKKMDYQLLDAQQTPEGFIASGAARNYALVVFLRPQAIRVERSESNSRQVSSQYQSGTRQRANPAYAEAEAELRAAEDQDADVEQMVNNAGNNQDMASALILAATAAAASSRLGSARSALQNTPQVIEEVVMTPYSYSAKTVAIAQTVKIPYAVYDTGTGKALAGSVNSTWSQTFAIADGVRDGDPSQANLLKSTKTSQYLESWINAPAKDKYDDVWKNVFSDYQKNSLGI